jgi:RimJ/RimL family protein N-acetyltransferase
MIEESKSRPVMNVIGEQVALGPLRHDLLETYHRWFNDFRTLRTTGARPAPLTLEALAAQYVAIATPANDPHGVSFTIYRTSDWAPIGSTRLQDVDFHHGTAEFVIFIGEPSERGKGHGTEATRLVLDCAFTALGLRNVLLKVYEFNLAGQRVYQKVGFRECGRRHACHFMGGRFWDVIYMECLAQDFQSPVLHQVFMPDVPRDNGSAR